jgi:hypothetical protein
VRVEGGDELERTSSDGLAADDRWLGFITHAANSVFR